MSAGSSQTGDEILGQTSEVVGILTEFVYGTFHAWDCEKMVMKVLGIMQKKHGILKLKPTFMT